MTQTPQMEQERPITLREQELLDRGQHLAEKLAVRDGLVESKKAEAKKRQDEIDDLDEEISELAEQIRTGFENRKQGDLFVDQALPKDEAALRLAEIAKRAERHPFAASETAIDTCAREACGKAALDETHQPPAPSEPHTYVPDGSGEGKCWACGSGQDDPIHAAPAEAVVTETETETHDGVTTTIAYTTPEPAFVECSRCTTPAPKAEVVYDREVKPICETCKRAAIEAGTWPHPFRKGHEKARRCADCNRKADDEVHADIAAVFGNIPATEPPAPVSSGDPAYDFDESEKSPAVIASARAIEDKPADGADDGPVGGEAGA